MEGIRRFGKKIKNAISNRRRWTLLLYDAILLLAVELMILGAYPSSEV